MSDLRASGRVSETGLTQILSDIVRYSFAGEPRTPPVVTRELLDKLVAPDQALCFIQSRKKKVLYL